MSNAPAASFGILDLDEGLRELIKPELAPGERLLWAARSGKRLALGGFLAYQAALAGVLGLTVTSVGGFLVSPWVRFHATALELAVGMSVLTGFGAALVLVITGVAWIAKAGEARRATSRTYALTDRRVILWTPGRSPAAIDVNSIPFTTIKVASLHRVQYGDGSGDLMLRGKYDAEASLRSIPDVQRVEKLLRDHLPRSAWTSEGVANVDDEFENISY